MPSQSEAHVGQKLSLIDQVRLRLESPPSHQVEESLLLRILVQLMVLVGIVATDVAASTQMSVWAIPLSIAGAVWSWRRRHQRDTVTKFLIAIGMLVALAAFMVGLRAELNDTRLVLAELLVQLQVLHSFHMPRRQDLGYSMMIGLILIGVASTLSQTMVFGLILLGFLAIALPVLVLDYRSRLALLGRPYRAPLQRAGISMGRLAIILLLVLSLGLTIFLSLPRLPGYQLRTFPVSGPNQDFNDNEQIINPGYVREGNQPGGEGSGAGEQQGLKPGKVDTTFYYGFNTRMNQNLRGEMQPKVVMRVRSQAEGFWRVLAFDRYLGQGWEISRNDQTETVQRPSWSYQFFLSRPWTLTRKKDIVQTYTVVSELPSLIPALTQAKELYFPTRQIAVDPEGNLRSPLTLQEGLTYTVISAVPYRDRALLREASTRYPAPIRDYYLEVPAASRDRIRRYTESLLAKSPQPVESNYERALYLAQELKQQFTLQADLPFFDEEEDMVSAFLFKYKGGYQDHFSTALTIMLRSIGIPSRLAVGFGSGEFNPFTGLYVVKNTDAYAVTEVYFPRYGWFTFDPIPGHELIPPSIEDDQTFSALRQFWKWVAGWLPSPVTSALSGIVGAIVGWVTGAIARLMNLLNQGWVGLFVLLLMTTAIAFAGWLLWQAWRRWRVQRWLASLPPMERLYQQMLRWLAQQGFRKHPAQTPLEYAQHMRQCQPDEQAHLIDDISQAYVQWRYGGYSANNNQLQQRLRQIMRQRRRAKGRAV